jgi:hypothetical protein
MAKPGFLQRINTRGPPYGQCNICGIFGKLTEDHTPPKSCGGITAAELRSLHDKLAAEGEQSSAPRHFQGGVCYRTLCGRCNGLLGTDYDPALASMCAQVREIAKSSLRLPQEVRLEIAPDAVMRSVLGHLAAQGVGRYLKGELTEPLRDYILDSARPLPPSLRVHYWLYPHRRQVLIRDAALLYLRTRAVFAFWLMKFFPVAFFVTINEPAQPVFQLRNLENYRDVPAAVVDHLYLPIRNLVPGVWPETPTDESVILYGPEAVVAEPVRRMGRKPQR